MSLQNVSNHKQLLIGKNAPTLPTAGTVATPSSLADGALAVTTLDGVILSDTTGAALADTTQIVIVQGQGSTKPLIKSTPFSRKDVINAKAKKYTPANQQASYIGFAPGKAGRATAGTTGTIELPAVGTSVILRNTFKTNFYQFSDKLMESVVGYKVTSATTTSTLVDYLTKYAIQDVQKYVNIPYSVERVNSSTSTSNTSAATTAVVRGSSVITTATPHASWAVGDYLRIGGSTVDYPLYKITAKTATTVTLDTAYQGDTATIAIGDILEVAPVTTSGTDGAGWGIRFTGRPQTLFGVNTFRYETSKFVTTAQNFGATTVKNAFSTGTGTLDNGVPTEGSGVYEQIAEEEFFFQLGEGMHDNNLIQIPPVSMRSNVELTGTYSIIDFEVATQSGTMSFINNPVARKQVRVTVNGENVGSSTMLTRIADVLEDWLDASTSSSTFTTPLT